MTELTVANTILKQAWMCGVDIIPIKLQTLMFYYQGFSLKIDNNVIISQDFYRIEGGVNIVYIYNIFKKYGNSSIESLEQAGLKHIYTLNENSIARTVVNEVIEAYGRGDTRVIQIYLNMKLDYYGVKMNQIIAKDFIKKMFKNALYGE